MITGIIIELNGKKAIVLKDDGSFADISAESGWQVGDVISVEADVQKRNGSFIYKAAACLLILFLIGGFSSYNAYYRATAMISIDVNPSIELHLNTFDRVISYTTYNDEGEIIADLVDIKYMKYEKAIGLILASDSLKNYTDDSSYFVFAVQTNNQKKEDILYSELQKTASDAISHHHSGAQAEYSIVDKNFVNEAHQHGLSPGKYKILLELKEVSPDIDIDSYCHDSIGTIKSIIDECGNHSENSGSSHDNNSPNQNSNDSDTEDEQSHNSNDAEKNHSKSSDDSSDSNAANTAESTSQGEHSTSSDSDNHGGGHGNSRHGNGHD